MPPTTPPAPPTPTLPMEILVLIAHHLPIPSVSVFSRTCRSLHHLLRPILDEGFELEAPDILEWAILEGQRHIPVERCLELGTPLPDLGLTTCLCWLAKDGSTEVVRVLLEHGIDPNEAGKDRLTALFEAVRHNRIDIARMLLLAGARVEARCWDTQLITAMGLARYRRNVAMQALLVSFSASVSDDVSLVAESDLAAYYSRFN